MSRISMLKKHNILQEKTKNQTKIIKITINNQKNKEIFA